MAFDPWELNSHANLLQALMPTSLGNL